MIAVPEECLMRWTAEEVRGMIESGAFPHPERFELVEGLILQKMGQNPPHRITLMLALEALQRAFGDTARVTAGVPLPLAPSSEPEPDVMVVEPGLRRDLRSGDVRLVVEVADASIRKDRVLKAALYARHGIPEYLILDVSARCAEIRRLPDPESESWGETLILAEGGEFTPLGAGGPIRVADLFGDEP